MSTHPPQVPEIEDTMCHDLYSAAQSTVRLYRDLLAPWGLTFQQLLAVNGLWKNKTMTPGEIGESLRLDSSRVPGLLSRMQEAGLIERQTDGADSRRVMITATSRSLDIRSRLGWLEECIVKALGVSETETTELIDRLHAVRASLEGFPRYPHPADLVNATASP